MEPRIILLFLLYWMISPFAHAQPDTEHEEIKGCHHRHNQIPMHPLTPEEEAMHQASAERSDTIDILNYNITIDLVNFATSSRTINANCEISFASKMDNIDHLDLDLLEFTIDSITANGQLLTYDYDGLLLRINLPTVLNTGDMETLTVYYRGTPVVDPTGFGGLDFRDGYAYNLGIGLGSNPYNYGRSWFPCFDNFVERSTYDYNIITNGINKGYGLGTFLGETTLPNGNTMRSFRMNQQIPTYLTAIAASSYAEVNDVYTGQYGSVPTQLLARPADTTAMKETFEDLDAAIGALEFWYGAYPWERVGYVTTIVGAMEHPTNIAYPANAGLGGNDFAHRRLMAHELAHCWWGDVVTLSSPANMWIKEGNAEYGAHLMTEFAEGQEAFIDQVKTNHHNEVLRGAHIDDGDFLPLSGLPYENTYGTHTYRKGASMLHNMRGYLGDSLFKMGQRAVLNDFAYDAINAEQYRDKLTEVTGYDMTAYFDAWIFNPGFSAFEINSQTVTPSGAMYQVDLVLQQKLRAAPAFHNDVPLEITFTSSNGTKYAEQIMTTGELTNASIDVSFVPEFTTINENNKLNMSHLNYQTEIDETGDMNLKFVEMALNINEISEPFTMHVDHYWVAPDAILDNPFNAQISSTHYWRIEGNFPTIFDAQATLEYKPLLDADLTGSTEQDLILVYRRDANHDWEEFPNYTKQVIIPTDGAGFIRMNEIWEGEYAFANGELGLFSNTSQIVVEENPLTVYPNPVQDIMTLEQEFTNHQSKISLELIAVDGKVVQKEQIAVNGKWLNHQLAVSDLPAGVYWVKLISENGFLLGVESMEKL